MNTVIKFPSIGAPTSKTISRGCNVDDNRRSGFVLLYKSIKDTPFYRDPSRKSLWLHLLLETAHERTDTVFNGNKVVLSRGQVVGSARSLGEACGISEDSARRSLEVFEKEGMITRISKQGTKGYTLITVLNYDPYQRGVSEHIGAELAAELQPASDKGLEGVLQSDCAELGAEFHAEDLNNINNKTNTKDLNTCAEPAFADSTPEVDDLVMTSLPVTETLPTLPAIPDEPVAIELTLNTGAEYPVTVTFASQMQSLYPAVNVAQELRAMCGWLLANPTKRKTKTGITRFINSWLAKSQDRGGQSGLSGYVSRGGHTDLTQSMTAEELNQRIREGF